MDKKWIPVGVGVVVLSAAATNGVMHFWGRKIISPSSNKVVVNSMVDSFTKQLPALEERVRKNPGDTAAVRNYAVALYATGDLEGAKQQYLNEEKLNPKDAVVANNLGNIFRDMGDSEGAVEYYQKSIGLQPKNNPAYVNLAYFYLYTLNKRDLAIAAYRQDLSANPEDVKAMLFLAAAYEQDKNLSGAAEMYRAVLVREPDNGGAKAGLERLAAKTGGVNISPSVKPTIKVSR